LAIQPPVVTGDICGRIARITFRSSLAFVCADEGPGVFRVDWAEAPENYASASRLDQPSRICTAHHGVAMKERCGNP
jgi:hypothetical protein